MNKHFLLIGLLLSLCVQARASVWYVDAAATQSGSGTSWDAALTFADLKEGLSTLSDGDTVYFKGGNYTFSSATDRVEITKSLTLIGGFSPSATGKVTQLPEYPVDVPTVFNGDVNNDGVPSSGDVKNIIYIDFTADVNRVVTIQGIDVMNSYMQTSTDCLSGAVYVKGGTAFIRNCHIHDNYSSHYGAAGCYVYSAKVQLSDCELYNNQLGKAQGAAIRTGTVSGLDMAQVVVERCALYNNNTGDAANKYGSTIYAGGGRVYLLNSTIVNNRGYSHGAVAIRNDNTELTVVSCTLGNNKSTRRQTTGKYANSYGSSIFMENNSKLRMVNTISVEDEDVYTTNNPTFYSENLTALASTLYTSGGYNLLGSVLIRPEEDNDQFTAIWQASDSVTHSAADVKLFKTILGDSADLKDNGGFSKTIAPLEMQQGASVAELQLCVTNWFPTWASVDASVDQRGWKRNAAVTCKGAMAREAKEVPDPDTTGVQRVGTYNIRILTDKDKDSVSWDARKPYLVQLIRDMNFDVVGVQEVSSNNNAQQESDLRKMLPEYTVFCWGRNSATVATDGERCGVIYKTSKYTCLDKGKFFVSKNPAKPAKDWDTDVRRVCVWVKLKDNYTGEIFSFLSTHLDVKGPIARREGARIICEKIQEVAGDYPYFVVGDFNCEPDEHAVHYRFSHDFDYARKASLTAPQGPEGTYGKYSPTEPISCIDYIYVRNAKVMSYQVSVEDYGRGVTPSDHYPVMIEAKLLPPDRVKTHVVSSAEGLQQAMDTALVGDTISLIKGDYALSAPARVARTLYIQGNGAKMTTTASRYFDCEVNSSLYLDSLTFDGLSSTAADTGAVAAVRGYWLQMNRCVVKNFETRSLGLMYAEGGVTMDKDVFMDNTCGENGCVSLLGIGANWNMEMSNCQFLRNEADKGAAVYVSGCPSMYVNACSFVENKNSNYGTFAVKETAIGTSARLVNCTFANNTLNAQSAFGNATKGGAAVYQYVQDTAKFYLINNTIVGNKSVCADEQGKAGEGFVGSAVQTVKGTVALYNNILAGNCSNGSQCGDVTLGDGATLKASAGNVYSATANMTITPTASDLYCSNWDTACAHLEDLLGGKTEDGKYIAEVQIYGVPVQNVVVPIGGKYAGKEVKMVTADMRDASLLGFDILNVGKNQGILRVDQSDRSRGGLDAMCYPGSMEPTGPIPAALDSYTVHPTPYTKFIKDGRLCIYRGTECYTILGNKIK